ncbi:uncharacterized protein LOC116305861 [Actinia tenebrosa]|uniref:Uncharacterized protein LOC116305861 n=1 Tax=Actinia tenebrosa TaxID=6105 RepID=A0A6P8IWE1_ACTTE|nr:uncharacterized protein LOC116305861 [Actinia tenebrosa]
MGFELANVASPNSIKNTVVFSMFEAPDSIHNLEIALKQYQDDVTSLQQETWRDLSFKLFFYGDYAFLCTVFGISGASGKYCCLWCLITQTEMQESLDERGKKPSRTIETLKEDNKWFIEAGSNIKKAKMFNNAIRPPLFDIPIEQVCLPGLHISIGIFNRLYDLLVQELHTLDIHIANEIRDGEIGNHEFQNYIEGIKVHQNLKNQESNLLEEAQELESMASYNAMRFNNEEEVEFLLDRADSLRSQANDLTLRMALVSVPVIPNEDGPCAQELARVLKKIGAERQAYHGGSFNGNHTNKCLKVTSIDQLK